MSQLLLESDTRTKIVATVGPACRSEEKLTELVQAGVDVFRLNMAHSKREQHQEVVNWIRAIAKNWADRLASSLILQDQKFAWVKLPNDLLECREGAIFRFIRGNTPANDHELTRRPMNR